MTGGGWFQSHSWTITRGFTLATFDSEAPSLMDYLGEMRWYMDAFFDRREGGIEVVGGVHKSVLPVTGNSQPKVLAVMATTCAGPINQP